MNYPSNQRAGSKIPHNPYKKVTPSKSKPVFSTVDTTVARPTSLLRRSLPFGLMSIGSRNILYVRNFQFYTGISKNKFPSKTTHQQQWLFKMTRQQTPLE